MENEFLSIYELNHLEEMRCANPLCMPGRDAITMTPPKKAPVEWPWRSHIITGRELAIARARLMAALEEGGRNA